MTPAIDITAEQRRTVLALLNQYLPGTTVWAYGSRVKRTSRPESDLDLVAFARPEQSARVTDLLEAFEESNLPFRVDLFVWDQVPEGFRGRIKAEGTELTSAGARERIAANGPYHGNGWTAFRLGDVCKKIGSGMTPRGGSKVYLDTGSCALIRSQNIHNDGFRRGGLVFIDEKHATTLESVEVQPHDVLLNITGDSVARCCQVSLEILPARVNQHVAIVRPDFEILDPQFLRYALIESKMQDRMLSWAGSGATRNALTKGMIESFEVLAPKKVREQRTIAHILGTLDDKIELNRRMNETLEAMARALFKSWFVDFDPVRAKMEGRDTCLPKPIADLFPDQMIESELGLMPDGWKGLPLSKVIEINPTRSLRKGEVAPYLDMANMPTKGHVPHAVVDRQFGSGMRFTNGDTLVARITPCLENGKTAYVDFLQHGETGWGSTEYIVLRPMPPLPNEFAYYLARSARFREFAIQNMTGTSGRQRAPAAALSKFPLTAPPTSVAECFGKFVRPLMIRATESEQESRALAALRDTLLPKLVSGELRTENAAGLLEGAP